MIIRSQLISSEKIFIKREKMTDIYMKRIGQIDIRRRALQESIYPLFGVKIVEISSGTSIVSAIPEEVTDLLPDKATATASKV